VSAGPSASEGKVIVRGGKIHILTPFHMTVVAPRYTTTRSRIRLRVQYAHAMTRVQLLVRGRRGSARSMHTVAARRLTRVRTTSLTLPRLRAGAWTLRVASVQGHAVRRTAPFVIRVGATLAAARRAAEGAR
jgi:hypothetical protein